jgi:hypothetical protein
MIKIKVIVVAVLLVAVPFVISACSCGGVKPNSAVEFSTLEQVATIVAKPSVNTAILDVNPESVRNKHGVIPGAIKLSGYNSFAVSELPSEKNNQLIFYCYNQSCGASIQAANRALGFGYAKVSVLKVGILGWNQANKSAL